MRVRTNGANGGGTWFGRVALAAGALIAVAGCTVRYTGYGPPLSPDQYKGGGVRDDQDPYVFDITTDADGCPAAVSVDPKWRKCPGQKPDCIRVMGGQSVQFQSPKNDFVLRFDPFRKTDINAAGNPILLPTVKNPTVAKPYTFTIHGTDTKCASKVVDPQIILD